jgi:hypothetical protein
MSTFFLALGFFSLGACFGYALFALMSANRGAGGWWP